MNNYNFRDNINGKFNIMKELELCLTNTLVDSTDDRRFKELLMDIEFLNSTNMNITTEYIPSFDLYHGIIKSDNIEISFDFLPWYSEYFYHLKVYYNGKIEYCKEKIDLKMKSIFQYTFCSLLSRVFALNLKLENGD